MSGGSSRRYPPELRERLSGFAGQVGFGGLAGGHIHRGGQVGEKGRESL